MVDVERLLEKLRIAKISLGKVKEANDQGQLNETFKEFGADVAALQQAAGLRQKDLKDPRSGLYFDKNCTEPFYIMNITNQIID